MTWQVRNCDALEGLRDLEPGSVDCIACSPPYWGLRDYGVDGQLGLESHPSLYLEKLWAIFDAAQVALKPSGVCFVNLGDTYFGGGQGGGDKNSWKGGEDKYAHTKAQADGIWLRPKQLLLIPSRFAIGMQERGWLLRNDICWHKPNALPSSVKDRFSCTYEHVFLFSKQGRYWFDLDAVREAMSPNSDFRAFDHATPWGDACGSGSQLGNGSRGNPEVGKNPGDCWDIPTFAFPEAHFATYPPNLVRRMVRAGCPAQVCVECGKPWRRVVQPTPEYAKRLGKSWHGHEADLSAGNVKRGGSATAEYVTLGWQPTCACSADTQPGLVLDPFCGSGTTGMVAVEEGRRFLGFDLSEEYCAMARRRIGKAQPPLTGVLA